MTEPTNNVQKGKDERPVQYLGDPGVIYSLCFSCVEEQAGIMEQLISGEMERDLLERIFEAYEDDVSVFFSLGCGVLSI